jgi:hypothetical protein
MTTAVAVGDLCGLPALAAHRLLLVALSHTIGA